jgi:hypothetical protein
MPIRTIPNSNPPLQYYLIAYDEQGRERREADNSLLSERVLQIVRDQPITDVFMMSHGWRGDVPAAVSQYDAWTQSLMNNTADVQAIQQRRPGFRPIFVGLHWPSLPWGDESLAGSFAIDGGAAPLEDVVAKAAAEQTDRLSAGAEAEAELRKIYRAYATLDSPDALPPEVEQAYRRLNDLLHPGAGGASGAPADDRPSFDPQAIFQAAKRDEELDMITGASFGALSWGTLLTPLKILSFWQMKDRARNLGEGGTHGLLLALQSETAAKDVRIHLMGHSFGCIVMTATAAGPKDDASTRKPVQSMVLAQGALSLWAYCESMLHDPGKPGYFSRLIKNKRVEGPLATTQSQYDRAVGKAYPLAAGVAQQESFVAELPTYGGVGAFGIQGVDTITTGRMIAGVSEDYGFQGGRIYNLNADDVISGNHGQNDAHSDIVHPEVAHVIWQAALPR